MINGSKMFENFVEEMEAKSTGKAPVLQVDPRDPIGRQEFEMLKAEFSNIISNSNTRILFAENKIKDQIMCLGEISSVLVELMEKVDNMEKIEILEQQRPQLKLDYGRSNYVEFSRRDDVKGVPGSSTQEVMISDEESTVYLNYQEAHSWADWIKENVPKPEESRVETRALTDEELELLGRVLDKLKRSK